MSDPALAFESITAPAAKIRAGQLSPVALTEALLDRIATLDGRLHAFIAVAREQALAEARAAVLAIRGGQDRGSWKGRRSIGGWKPDSCEAGCFRGGFKGGGGWRHGKQAAASGQENQQEQTPESQHEFHRSKYGRIFTQGDVKSMGGAATCKPSHHCVNWMRL